MSLKESTVGAQKKLTKVPFGTVKFRSRSSHGSVTVR